jgi:hypothetical protein
MSSQSEGYKTTEIAILFRKHCQISEFQINCLFNIYPAYTMVFLFFFLLSLAASFAKAQTTPITGGLSIQNNCQDETVYYWSIGGSVGPRHAIEYGHGYGEYFYVDPVSHGVTIALSKNPDGINNGSPVLNIQYNVDIDDGHQAVWYELVTVNGSPFEGHSVWLRGDSCPEIRWEEGVKLRDELRQCFVLAQPILYLC